jgi:hypothetical protein
MAHFAKLDENNIVIDVIVISNEFAPDPAPENSEPLGLSFIEKLSESNDYLKGKWVQTSYNNSFRNKYAKIGNIYDEELNVFIEIQPYPSWTLNEDYDWVAPVPMPEEEGPWEWNEEFQNWEKTIFTED